LKIILKYKDGPKKVSIPCKQSSNPKSSREQVKDSRPNIDDGTSLGGVGMLEPTPINWLDEPQCLAWRWYGTTFMQTW
jgi:hypothetical protein